MDSSSDDDQSDGNADDSFKPVISGSEEESDSSCEIAVKPKATPRKRKKFVFLDLTCHEVIEDEDHEDPDATADELEKVCENFLQSLQTETVVQTPAPNNDPAKKAISATATKRKLFTPNYDNEIVFEEFKTPGRLPSNNADKIIQLKKPIPSFLIPPEFRDRQRTDNEVIHTPINAKKIYTPRTPVPRPLSACGFLESLDGSMAC